MPTTQKAQADERWDVWYDVYDHRGDRDSEFKEFKSYKAALRFADRHPGSAIDHYIGDNLVG